MEVLILHSAAGYYIGTLTEEGFPNDRFSGYYPTKELAEADLFYYQLPEHQISYFLQ